MAFIIVISASILGIATVAFMVLVAGVRCTDRRLTLRDRSSDRLADAFARRVLGVYVRQPEDGACRETETTCRYRVGR